MAGSVEENAGIVLRVLSQLPRDGMGHAEISGQELVTNTGLDPAEINDAVTILVEGGYAEWRQYLGTAPFVFGTVSLTARGRFEYEKAEKEAPSKKIAERTMRFPTPVGSPYGFQDQDWEFLSEKKEKTDRLYVVFGFQFASSKYQTDLLKGNVEAMFRKAVENYNRRPGAIACELDFRALAAGYGEHLFNEIARDIISADIAVFDTSDLNPNVMLEMGVALTWGVRVIPVKERSSAKPPSDISGQTWADYEDSAQLFVDPEHDDKLLRVVDRAIRKKGRA